MQSLISAVLDGLTTKKGAALVGVALLALVGLFHIARNDQGGVRAAASLAAAPAPAVDASGSFTPAQVKALHQIFKDYLVQNPEVMLDVQREIEKRQQAMQAAENQKVILENKAKIFSRPTDFVLGNAKGDVSVVEFFDYNCGWCKRALDDVSKLAKADPKVRIVMKELPIFGENSIVAAKAAMASIKQGKYWEFHSALMKEKQVTKDNVFEIAKRVGLDVAKLRTEMNDPRYEEALKETSQLAQALNIEGTPGFIVDARVNVGYVPVDGLQQMIAEVRKSGCKAC